MIISTNNSMNRIVAALSFIAASQATLAVDDPTSISSAMLEEIIVTARKREEPLQDVPLSISAFTSDQLEALKVRDFADLSVGIPNVALDEVGTFRSVANFTIRGLGVNSSIPSIDPTVGVFVDGVYMGQSAGIVIDMFDIQSIEVLRGPQGTLFGRNVTGGAVLINSKKPTDQLEISVRGAIDGNWNGDGGWNKYIMGSISAPLGEQFGFRMSFYKNKDDGWFTNLFNDNDFGAADTTIYRPVLSWQPNDNVQMILRWEHTESNGQGPAGQSHTNGRGIGGFYGNFERDSFDFSIDEEGFYDSENDLVTFQIDWDVSFGNGTITNIFGWRDYQSSAASDIDAAPVWLFHSLISNNSEQWSDELRYNGTFGRANITAGVYWFSNEINYTAHRKLLGLLTGGVAAGQTQSGGGNYWVDSLAFFSAVDYDLSENWILNGGIRYTTEDKKVEIASQVLNVNKPCNVIEGSCPYDFRDKNSWNAWSGKLGATYIISADNRVYGFWSRSHRSGGYNLRNTSIDTVNFGPGPFGQETVDNFELGYKSELSNRSRFSAAVFYMQIDDMQREVTLSDPNSGVVQVIRNTADADIRGFELEGTFALGDSTVLLASVGWIDPRYQRVFYDLNGDGVIDQADKDLKLPRAAKWTYSIGLVNDLQLGSWGYLSSRINYAYRDDSAFTDNNLGYLLSQQILDAGLDFHMADKHWILSVYGKNLLNDVKHSGDTQLPALLGPVPLGGTFSPLVKGRVLGLELSYNYF